MSIQSHKFKRLLHYFLSAGLAIGFTKVPVFATSADVATGVKKPALAGNTRKQEASRYRLPAFAVPSEYELTVEPDLAKFTFSGSETVKLELKQSTKEIVLNALELKITEGLLTASDGRKINVEVSLDPSLQKVSFRCKELLKPGNYQLSCKFTGTLNDQLRGFYRAGYKDDAKQKHWLAATQMEPTDARRMFPCFDEPGYKGVFKIKAIIDKKHVAISNSPVQSEEEHDSKKIVSFEPTPKMSTYLLALVIGDLKCAGEITGGSVPIRVWAVNGKEHLGKYALSEAGKILDFQAKYFNIPYAGKKLDLIALPEFSAGAMENLGAITYHDSDLLMDEKTGSSFEKQSIFGVTAHEMAHQWFGDLVTMSWWDDLWLNEAFATWMSTKVEQALHPEWRSMTESVYSRNYSMSTDSLKSTRAIHAEVVNPSQAIEMFDGITYSKGASVLRMLESFVGEDAFQKGITKYLDSHSFSNATARDFWSAIAAQSPGVPVEEIMRHYVYQPGFPQVNVKLDAENKNAELTQYRQLRMGQDKADPSTWLVPIVLRQLAAPANANAEDEHKDDSNKESWLFKSRKQEFPLKYGDSFFLNAGGRGYYRVCYEPKRLKLVQDGFFQLTPEEKIVLISDCSSLVFPGDVPVEDLYNFVYKAKDEQDPLIQSDLVGFASAPFDYVRENKALLKTYERWARHVLIPLKQKLDGWNQKPDDSQQTKSLRSSVLNMLGNDAQDPETIKEAFALFEKYCKDRSSINPDLRATVLGIVAFNGGKKEYDRMLQLYRTAKIPADAELALGFLDGFHQPELARRTIALGMSREVKLQEGLGLICGVAYNYYTRDLGWNYIKQHWQEIMHHFPENHLASLSGICHAYDTPDREKEFRDWYAHHPIPFSKSRTARALESMHTHVVFKQRYRTRIEKWVMAQAARLDSAK